MSEKAYFIISIDNETLNTFRDQLSEENDNIWYTDIELMKLLIEEPASSDLVKEVREELELVGDALALPEEEDKGWVGS